MKILVSFVVRGTFLISIYALDSMQAVLIQSNVIFMQPI